MVKVLDQFGLQAAIPAVIFGPAHPQASRSFPVAFELSGKRVSCGYCIEGVEQGSARLLRGDVDVAPRAGRNQTGIRKPVLLSFNTA